MGGYVDDDDDDGSKKRGVLNSWDFKEKFRNADTHALTCSLSSHALRFCNR
jgi:hypothetical protein